jgi:UDP-2-acetamido-2,6-beta-L-arabino-hexul-4-ose reductase
MKVLVTGANGFIGKNLVVRLNELDIAVETYTRDNSVDDLPKSLKKVDLVFHLAGENRPLDDSAFEATNIRLTESICNTISLLNKQIPIVYASTVQAENHTAYGKSKLKAELLINKFESDTGNPGLIYRLPGVFGKWSKPNYNSVVSTFCYNICNNIPIQINDASSELNLVYIDDVVEEFVSLTQGRINKPQLSVRPKYTITVGELANQIKLFNESRVSLISEKVGEGFIRKLYSTYVSYFSPKQFSYSIPSFDDERGEFAEVLKTKDSGQFSFFSVEPGMTRGGHYHHSKTEKFLVVRGDAKFGFKNIISGETQEIFTSEEKFEIVETIPGWAHDITNIGLEKMFVILWANEIYDRNNSDTIQFYL